MDNKQDAMEVRDGVNENIQLLDEPQSTLYNVNYTVEKSQIAYCNIPNELIIDNTGDNYLYEATNTKINGQSAQLTLNTPGSLLTLNALNSDEVLEFQLKDDNKPHPITPILDEECINTQYGFRLSEVMSSIGNFIRLSTDSFPTANYEAEVTLTQRAFIIEKDCKKKVIFNFYLQNTGNESARRILFKDLFPQGVTLTLGGIFVNGCYAYPEYSNIEGRRLFIRIPDMPKRGSATLTLVCNLSEDYCPDDVNVGVIAYVSKYGTDPSQQSSLPSASLQTGMAAQTQPKYRVNIKQNISNMKSLGKIKKGIGNSID